MTGARVTRRFTVQQVAEQVGKSSRTLKRYEIAGKIPKAQRDLHGYRTYTEEDVMAIRRLLYPENDPAAKVAS